LLQKLMVLDISILTHTYIFLKLRQLIKISCASLAISLLFLNYNLISVSAFFLGNLYFCNLSLICNFIIIWECLIVKYQIIFLWHFICAFIFVGHLVIHYHYVVISLISNAVLIILIYLVKAAVNYFWFFFQKVWEA